MHCSNSTAFVPLKVLVFLEALLFLAQTAGVLAQIETAVPDRLTLAAAEALLLNYNPRLKADRSTIEMEEGDVTEAEKRPNPILEFRSEGLGSPSALNNPLDRQQVSLVAAQEILTAGKTGKRVRLEQIDVEIAEMEYQNTLRLIKFELKQAYYLVVSAQRDLALAQEILQQFKGMVALNRARFEKGEISGGEIRRIEAAQYSFQDDLIAAEVLLQNAQHGLVAVIGLPAFGKRFEAIDGFQRELLPPPAPELVANSLRGRPDLAADKTRIVRAERYVTLQEALAKADVTIFAGFRRDFGLTGAIAGVQIPLFVFNRNQGPLARAQAGRRRQQERLYLREINVSQEVHVALNELTGNARRIESLRGEYLEKAQQSRAIAESAYRLGAASLIEFLEAERTYRETSRLYNRALYDYQVSRAKLELAVGRDF